MIQHTYRQFPLHHTPSAPLHEEKQALADFFREK